MKTVSLPPLLAGIFTGVDHGIALRFISTAVPVSASHPEALRGLRAHLEEDALRITPSRSPLQALGALSQACLGVGARCACESVFQAFLLLAACIRKPAALAASQDEPVSQPA